MSFLQRIENRIFYLNNKGFTLVETIITVFIFVSMSAAITMTLIAGQNSWEANRVKIILHQNLRIAAEKMKEDLQGAGEDSIVVGSVNADGTWYTSIEFRVPVSVDAAGNITWQEYTTKFLLGGGGGTQLIKRLDEGEASEEDRIISENIKLLRFKREVASPGIVIIDMYAEMKVGTGDNVKSYYLAKIKLRN